MILLLLVQDYAGYTYIDKAAGSYIDNSTPLLTSSFTLGLAKANFIKEDQRIGFLLINHKELRMVV
jgi:hypothetical protein